MSELKQYLEMQSEALSSKASAEDDIIHSTVSKAKAFYDSNATRSVEFRLDMLKKLKKAINENEELINEALKKDLNKHPYETYMCETGLVLEEIDFHLRNLRRWSSSRSVRTAMSQMPGSCYEVPEPLGVVLIISPWNYPIQLCLMPLIGAISSGNCAVIKPSAYAPASSSAIKKIIESAFPPEYISVIEGGREENKHLLDESFDYFFFTGSVEVGKSVMEAAAKHLAPVTLELGGKSPVILDETADIKSSAKKIAFGKVLNAGQTCVAPDYLLIQKSVKEQFIKEYEEALKTFFPTGDMSDMVHIINRKHFDRLQGVLKSGKIILGGKTDKENLFIEPTLLDDVPFDSPAMTNEIFGPILPIITYENIEECIKFIRSRPKPLALYLFTQNRAVKDKIFDTCSFGGGCVNDTVMHLVNSNAGFGGVGSSGMGCYHGKKSFDTFTHYRTVYVKSAVMDVPVRYFPYSAKKEKLTRKILG